MAFPQVESTSYGHSPSSSGSLIAITMPSGLLPDEFVYGFMATEDGTVNRIESSSGNFNIYGLKNYSYGRNVSIANFSGRALGGGSDFLNIYWTTSVIVYYIVYRISGHGMYSSLDGTYFYNFYEGDSNFISPALALPLEPSSDKLFITSVAYTGICTSLSAPSGFSNVIHNPEPSQTYGNDAVSVGSARIESTSGISQGTWGNSPLGYDQHAYGFIVRIKPGDLGKGGVADPGIGIKVAQGHIGLV